MTDTRYLVHGVFWDGTPASGQEDDGGSPVLRLEAPSGAFREVSLHPGARLGFQVSGGGCARTRRAEVIPTAQTAHPKIHSAYIPGR